jgi:Delta7-sterol 5-desaturase
MNWDLYFKYVTIIGSRYMILTTLAFIIFYILLRKTNAGKKIQLKYPKSGDYSREIFFSVLTIFIMAFTPAFILGNQSFAKHTQFYTEIKQYGWIWFTLAFPIMAIVHDTYFYWMHRLIHHPDLFRAVHLIHHKSINPSPFAAYAFHPLEAVLEAGIFIIFVFLMPIHFYHLLFFFLFMIIYNVYGHLGWELYPKGFNKYRFGKWINTSVAHNMHHHYFKGNYGLYFLFWDRLMGTLRDDYDEHFEEVKARKHNRKENNNSTHTNH